MSAAEDPSPVLCTSARVTPVYANGGILDSDETRGSSPSSASWKRMVSANADVYRCALSQPLPAGNKNHCLRQLSHPDHCSKHLSGVKILLFRIQAEEFAEVQ